MCERLAIDECLAALVGTGFAVACRSRAVGGGEISLLGGLRALSLGSLALRGSAHHDLRAGDQARAVVLSVGAVASRHREVACGGRFVARERREIAGVGGRVPPLRGVHSIRGRVVVLIGLGGTIA